MKSISTESMQKEQGSIKCVVWDLDNTIWEGTLLEDKTVCLKKGIAETVRTLDARGILQSVASRNDFDRAMKQLSEFGLDEYFLYPQISWNSKTEAIKSVSKLLNISPDSIAFVDDELAERAEVYYSYPEIMCIDPADASGLPGMPEFTPRSITDEAVMRRKMYMNEIARNNAQKEFAGTNEEFLATLQMELTIFPASGDDLKRAEELTLRTHQLNSTGKTYSFNELDNFRHSDNFKLLTAELKDKYGNYGHTGLALVECNKDFWTIKLLIVSCRVMSRGVGSVLLNFIMRLARDNNVNLFAEFVPNENNRLMDIAYRLSGFYDANKKGNTIILKHDLDSIQPFPAFMKVSTPE